MKKILLLMGVFCLTLNLATEAIAIKADSFYASQFEVESWLNKSRRHVRIACIADYCEITKIIANGSIELYSNKIHLENNQQAIISCPVNICNEKINELTIYTDDGYQIPVDIFDDENKTPHISTASNDILLNVDSNRQNINKNTKELPNDQINRNDNQCKFEISLSKKRELVQAFNTYHDTLYLNITCLSDKCKINGLVVNRGNKDFIPMMGRTYPIDLKFGDMVLFVDNTWMRALEKATQGGQSNQNNMEIMQKWMTEIQNSPESSSPVREVKIILDGQNFCDFYFDHQ